MRPWPRDLARFGELYRNGGRTPDGRQVVPASWVGESTTMTEVSQGDYAYQWWAGAVPGSYEASGYRALADRLGACPLPPHDERSLLQAAGGPRVSRRAALRRRALRLVLRASERTRV